MTEGLAAERKTLLAIWGVLMSGVALYAVVTYTLVQAGVLEPVLDASLVYLVGLASVAPLALSFALRRMLVDKIPPDADEATALAGYRTAVVIGLALAEAAGLLVITVGFLSGSGAWILMGGMGCLVIMAIQKPDPDSIVRRR